MSKNNQNGLNNTESSEKESRGTGYDILFEAAPLGIMTYSNKGEVIGVNRFLVDLLGSPSLEATKQIPLFTFRNLVESGISKLLAEALESREPVQLETAYTSKWHKTIFMKIIAFPVKDEAGNVLHGMAVVQDVTFLKQTERQFRESEEKYLGLMEHLTDFVYTLDMKGNLLGINRAAARSAGFEPEDLIGRNIEDFIPPAVRKHIAGNLEKVEKEGFHEGLSQYMAKDGTVHYLEYRSVAIHSGDRPHYMVGIARDVTDRILMKKRLKESETKFRLLVENAHDGITYIDESSRLQFCNARMKEILKDPHPEGKNLLDYYDAENADVLKEHLEVRSKGISSTYFSTITDLEGNPHHMVVSGTPYFDEKSEYKGAIGIYTDISELKKLEAQLQQSQKMEAIGTLAGGIAHDFNNILSGVLGYASLMKKLLVPDSQLAHYAEMIEKSAERGAALAGQLLGFSRKGKPFVQNVDIHQLIDDVVEILKRTVDRKISVVTNKGAGTSTIEGDPGQIQQMLMNLCINAKDAMPKGGQLTIATGVVEIEVNSTRLYKGLLPGSFLQLTVEDTGEGMTPQVMERLFEPFFTTKEEGKGTGLGLSMVYGTVKHHGGIVKVYSEPGHGSVFIVLLPIKQIPDPAPESVTRRAASRGTGTILVIDDEEIMQQLLAEMLQEMGFSVLLAHDGVEGLEVYRKQWQRIDLVIVDMIMPRLSGRETFLAMKEINPTVKTILSTGFSKNGEVLETLERGIAAFIQKPFRADELSDVIASVLFHESPVG